MLSWQSRPWHVSTLTSPDLEYPRYTSSVIFQYRRAPIGIGIGNSLQQPGVVQRRDANVRVRVRPFVQIFIHHRRETIVKRKSRCFNNRTVLLCRSAYTWTERNLRWALMGTPSVLDMRVVIDALKAGFRKWTAMSPFTFRQVRMNQRVCAQIELLNLCILWLSAGLFDLILTGSNYSLNSPIYGLRSSRTVETTLIW